MTKTIQAHFSTCITVLNVVLLGIACTVSYAEAGTTRYVSSSGGDDTAAINAAIGVSSAGDRVYLNAGAFSITGPIQAKTGVALVGAGKTNTTVRCSGGGNAMVNLGGVNNVEVANFTLNGNSSAAQGINASSGSGQYIHDIRIQNFAANAIGVYFSSGVTDSRIVNNQFSNIGVGSEWGAGVRMSWGSSRNQVLNNTIANTGRGGILANDGSTNLVIKNNTISGSGGVGLGVEVWGGCDRALIQNNVMDHWLSVDNSSNVAVRRNMISDKSGTYKYAGLEMATGGSDNVFSSNLVDGGAQIGISVSGGGLKQRTYWANNTVKGASTWGAQIQADSGGVQQMYFYKNTFKETPANSPVALYSNQGHGFRFNPNNGTIQNVTLDSNTITANAGIGIQGGDNSAALLDKLKVVNNTITNNGGAAFTRDWGSTGAFFGSDLRWQGNTVTGNSPNNQPASKGTFFGSSPLVSIVGPSTATAGQLVPFSLSYSGASPLTNVLWDFDDGLPATTSSASFTYSDPGVYMVGLVVWDSLGRAAHAQLSLSITAPEPSTWSMLVTGGVAILLWIWRRRPQIGRG